MREILVRHRDTEHERKTHATWPPDDPSKIVADSARLVDADTGETVALHLLYTPDEFPAAGDLLARIRRVPMVGANGARLSGIASAHQVFGNVAPVPLRRRYGCSRSRFDEAHPALAARLEEAARLAWGEFQRHAPDRAAEHVGLVDEIPEPWWFGGAPWTSGVINDTAALHYHRDAGNVKRSWSAMWALRRGVAGGLLHLAEYDTWLTIPHRSLTIFDGQSTLHAVTPFVLDGTGAYRYTIVFYAKAAMTKCLCGEDEVRRAQQRRSESEDRIAAEVKARANADR